MSCNDKTSNFRRSINAGLFAAILIFLFAALLFFSSGTGPDYEVYQDWANAALTVDIFKLRSPVVSPMGIPLSQWSPGPGLLFGLGKLVTEKYGTDLAGWAGALVFWWAMLRILNQASGGDPVLTLLGAAAAFLGTHAGIYTLAYGSESFAYPAAAVLALWSAFQRSFKRIDFLIAGCAAGLLMMVRSQLVIYAVPAILIFVYRAMPSWREKDIFKKAADMGLLLLPPVVAIIQIGWTNRWMTGKFWQSPYSFGSGSFRSVDWAQPEFLAVLTHPFHGLLTYHPLYLIAFSALISRFFQAGSRPEKWFYAAVGLVTCLHLYMHASWYGWWLGGNSFGQRGMAVAAVFLMPPLIRHISELRAQESFLSPVFIGLTLLACFWSYLMMCQGIGGFNTYESLMEGMRANLGPDFWKQKSATMGIAFSLFLAVRRKVGGKDAEPLRGDECAALFLAALCFSYLNSILVSIIFRYGMDSQPTFALFASILAEAGLLLAVFLCGYSFLGSGWQADDVWGRNKTCLASGVIVVFAAAQFLFFKLAVDTEIKFAAGAKPTGEFQYAAAFQLDEARMTYDEYLRIPGFEKKKQALGNFLLAEEVRQKILRAATR